MTDDSVGRAYPGAPPDSAAEGTGTGQRRKHLRRLPRIFQTGRAPLFLVTVCVRRRAHVLAEASVHGVLVEGWTGALCTYGWMVGRYVVMPDHVHFFAAPARDAPADLSSFVGRWKQWTQRRIRLSGQTGFAWQREFFDHLLRSSESYSDKWQYVRLNPVRTGLVSDPQDWPYQGEIRVLRW